MRESALIATATWRRPEFIALHRHSQLLYFAIRTTPTLNRAGVTTLLPAVWHEWTGLSLAEIEKCLSDLRVHEIIAVDNDTCELFIGDAIRDEFVLTNPPLLERAICDAETTRSRRLRRLVAAVFEAHGSQRALDGVATLLTGVELEANPVLRRRAEWITSAQLKRLRRQFLDCAGRRRLRAEIAAGVHVCPCGATTDLTVDHIIPLALGGTNTHINLQVLCLSCNCTKGAQV